MRNRSALRTGFLNVVFLLATGVGVGWLIGLSVSPVLHIIVGSVIAVAAGAVGSLAGLDAKSKGEPDRDQDVPLDNRRNIQLDPLPLALLVVGLAIGAPLGIYVRTNDLLGPKPERFAQKWSGTELNEDEIQKRLFDTLYPASAADPDAAAPDTAAQTDLGDKPAGPSDTQSKVSSSKTSPEKKANVRRTSSAQMAQLSAGLYSVRAKDCELILLKRGKELRDYLVFLGNRQITELANKCGDDRCLEKLKETLCSQAKSSR